MAFGLKVWDASGNVIIDTTSRLPRLVHSLYISAGTVGSVEIPAVADKVSIPYRKFNNQF